VGQVGKGSGSQELRLGDTHSFFSIVMITISLVFDSIYYYFNTWDNFPLWYTTSLIEKKKTGSNKLHKYLSHLFRKKVQILKLYW